MCTPEESWKLYQAVQEANPLVQCITNLVSMDLMANMLLAFGANPAMVHSMEEVEEFVAAAGALAVNVGTLEPMWVASMKLAATRCVAQHKHWVLDPVGAGATTYRTNAIKALLACKPSVVRGNASEVMTAAGLASTIKGAESSASVGESVQAAKDLAKRIGCVVAVSGAVDYVTDGQREAFIRNGTPMLTKITAAGCSLNAVIAAACAAQPNDTFKATVHSMALYELAAEIAEEKAVRKGPASVRQGLLDELYLLQEQDVLQRIKIESS